MEEIKPPTGTFGVSPYNHHHPEKRYTSVAELIEELKKYPPDAVVMSMGEGYETEMFSPWPTDVTRERSLIRYGEDMMPIWETVTYKESLNYSEDGKPVSRKRQNYSYLPETKVVWL